MSQNYNIYCDESCHIENDHQKVMVLGAVSCQKEKRNEIFKRIREIKEEHNLAKGFEAKWTKVSESKINFYLDLINYFFDNNDLSFRGLIAYKNNLNHGKYSQTHNEWYYKMYFEMLKTILSPSDKYQVYIDIKDTIGGQKVKKLHEVLCNNMFDFNKKIIKHIQIIRSDEVEVMQLTDLLIGALGYFHRQKEGNKGKKIIIEKIKERSNYSLLRNTLYKEQKFNLFIWNPKND